MMFIAYPPRQPGIGIAPPHAQFNQKSGSNQKSNLLFSGMGPQTKHLQESPDHVTFTRNKIDQPALTLLNALRKKDYEKLGQILARNPELANIKDPEDQTPILLEAVALRDLTATQLLLESGADRLGSNPQGITPVILATANGDVPMVELLLDQGAPLHSYYGHNNTPLIHLAVQAGSPDMLAALKKAGANINTRDAVKRTPLHMMADQEASSEDPKVVQWLLDNGAELEAKDHQGYTPLHRAVLKGNAVLFQILQQAGADVDTQNNLGLTPYLTAAGTGQVRLMKVLQTAGANTEARTSSGLPVLHWAAGLNQAETLRHLLSPKYKNPLGQKINPNQAAGPADDTPLHLAVAFQSNDAIAELVKERGNGISAVDWHILNKNAESPWTLAQKIGSEFSSQWRTLAEPLPSDITPRQTRTGPAVPDPVQPDSQAPQLIAPKSLEDPTTGNTPASTDLPVRHTAIANTAQTDPKSRPAKKEKRSQPLSPQTPSLSKKADSKSSNASTAVCGTEVVHSTSTAASPQKLGKSLKKGDKKNTAGKPVERQAKPEMDEIDEACLAVYGGKVNDQNDTFQDILQKYSKALEKLDDQGKFDFVAGHLNALNVNNPYPIEVVSPTNPTDRRAMMATPLHVAILSGMPVKWVQLFMEKGADPTIKDTMGRSPFHIAAQTGNVNYLNALTGNGKFVSQLRKADLWKNVVGNTPLHEAAITGHLEAVQWLLSKKFPINVKNENEETPLHLAVKAGQADVVSELLKQNANPEIQNNLGRTALHLAALTGDKKVLLAFEQAAKKIFPIKNIKIWKNLEESTPLHEAAKAGHIEAVQWFLDHGFPINEPNNTNETALHLAAEGGHTEIAKLLLAHGANPKATTKAGLTPLHSAVHTLASETLETLLRSKQFDPGATLVNGSPALHVAVVNRDLQSVRLLLAYGANVNQAEQGGRDALQLAVMLNDPTMVDELLKHGADPTHLDSEGANVLHHLLGSKSKADSKMELVILRRLVEQLPQVTFQKMINQSDKRFQNTPLHLAIAIGNSQAAKLLLMNGADPTLRNTAGKNSLMAAVDNHFPANAKELVNHLLSLPGDQVKCMLEGKTSEEGANALHLAAALNLSDVLGAILKKQQRLAHQGIRVDLGLNDQDEKGNTPLHYASVLGHVEALRYLIAEGAAPNLPNRERRTPLMAAIESVPRGDRPDSVNTKKGQIMVDALLDTIGRQADQDSAAKSTAEQAIQRAVNQSDLTGYTPLQLAATQGSLPLMNKLLKYGADPTLLNEMGGSALHIAADFENESVSSQMVESLLSAFYRQGGKTLVQQMGQLKDSYGITPQEVARVLKRPDLAQRIRHYKPEQPTAQPQTETAILDTAMNIFAGRRVFNVPFSIG